MKQIKVLLADYPHIIPDGVKNAFRALREREDRLAEDRLHYVVDDLAVGKAPSPMDVLVWVKSNKPDGITVALGLVLGLGLTEEAGLLDHLHETDRNLTILGVAHDMRSAFIEQLCPQRREILNPTEDSMLAALCHAIRAPCRTDGR